MQAAYLLFDSLSHTLENPDDPRPFCDLGDPPKVPTLNGTFFVLLFRLHQEEELEKPFSDIEESDVILFCDFRTL